MRGGHLINGKPVNHNGSIPAYAGGTLWIYSEQRHMQVDPRVCGGD